MKIENSTPFKVFSMPMLSRGDKPALTIIVKATYCFSSNEIELAEEQAPIAFGDQLCDDGRSIRYETDLVPYKPNTDVVLSGKAHAPDNNPVESLDVFLKVGPVEKRLKVFGRRLWNFAGILSRRHVITKAKRFKKCSILYTQAFGGIDQSTGDYCRRNLSGKGFYSKNTKTKLTGQPLPRIEDPRHLIRSPEDHPNPVGFGYYHRSWFPRARYAGTYDDTWRAERKPLQPKDFNYRFYNGAHPDLQVKEYLRGDEPVELVNLTPEGEIRFHLPGMRPHCRLQRQDQDEIEHPALNLDTVFIESDQKKVIQVWRANASLSTLSNTEIESLSIAADTLESKSHLLTPKK